MTKILSVYTRRSWRGCQRCGHIFGGSTHVIKVQVDSKIVKIRSCEFHAIMARMQKAVA